MQRRMPNAVRRRHVGDAVTLVNKVALDPDNAMAWWGQALALGPNLNLPMQPEAIAPACGTVRLDLRSQKEPAKADVVTADPKVLEQIWADFAVYRAP